MLRRLLILSSLAFSSCTAIRIDYDLGKVLVIEMGGKEVRKWNVVNSYTIGPPDINGNRALYVRRSFLFGGNDVYWLRPWEQVIVRGKPDGPQK